MIAKTLSFFGRSVPLMMQTEAAECGLACLAMVAGFHGYKTDLATLRREHAVSLKGSTLKSLIDIAQTMQLASRPLRVEMAGLAQLRLPAITHFDFNHFVVLTAVSAKAVTINDPARGERTLSLDEFSKHFTGIALELTPTPDFVAKSQGQPFSVASMFAGARGLKRALIRIIALALAFEVFALAMPWLTQLTVDEVLVSADRNLMTVLAIGFALIVLVQTAILALRGWLVLHLTSTLSLQLLTQLFSHLLRLPLSFFEKRHVGDLLSRFSSMDAIQRTLTGSTLEALIDGVLALSMLIVMFIYSVKLTLAVLVVALIYAVVRWILFRPMRDAVNEQLVFLAQQQTHFIESLRGMQAIKLAQGEADRLSRWQNALVDSINASIRSQSLTLIYRTASFTLFGLQSVLIIWLGAGEVLSGVFSVGMLLAFLAYQLVFVTRLGNLIDKIAEFKLLNLHAERVADVALAEKELRGTAIAPNLSTARWQIEDLGFRYGPQDAFIFRHVSFTIEAGESVALTGASGAGKTTLAKVVVGLLPATEGRVLIDGIDIREIDPATLRTQLAAVMQEDYVFAGSLAENVSLFDPQTDATRVTDALLAAALLAEVEKMPMRTDTLVGNMGSTLSGGQRQRLLLARALYRKPKFLLLDEATSALDSDREQAVNQVVKNLGITTLLIAHRESTVAMAGKRVSLGI
ncbi:MAG: peptidase domain-containing ABC transporter [Betaproteobacteria bacterium]|nr:MAG: peptidase domain-containing ABC transporter [Betaproteobacteria bacterium]